MGSPFFLDEVLEYEGKKDRQEREKWIMEILNSNLRVNEKVREEWTSNDTRGTIFEKVQDTYIYEDPQITLLKKLGNRIKKETAGKKELQTIEKIHILTNKGKKEKDGKLHYELSWEFIEEMAKRMANNKSDKYPLYNWKKSIDVQDLKDAINRHHIEVMKGNYSDGEEILGHIVSYACNSMMLWEQLNSTNG